MNIWQSVILAIGLSMDACAVGMTNGMKDPKLNKKQVLLIAFVFGLFQGLMPLIGYIGGHFFQNTLTKYTAYIALVLLTFLGLKMIIGVIRDKNKIVVVNEKKEDTTIKDIILQGVATSIDALSVGILFVHVVFSSALIYFLIIFVITVVTVYFSVFIGKKFGSLLKENAQILGGIILISIGVFIFVDFLIG